MASVPGCNVPEDPAIIINGERREFREGRVIEPRRRRLNRICTSSECEYARMSDHPPGRRIFIDSIWEVENKRVCHQYDTVDDVEPKCPSVTVNP
jgi:hypothetical protein